MQKPKPTLSRSEKSVLMTMALLGATVMPLTVYGNVKDGKQAWDKLLAEQFIIKERGFYVLNDKGVSLVNEWTKNHQG